MYVFAGEHDNGAFWVQAVSVSTHCCIQYSESLTLTLTSSQRGLLRAKLVKPHQKAVPEGRPAEEGCSEEELLIAITILLLLSDRITDLYTQISQLPNAATARLRLYFGKSALPFVVVILVY